MASSPIALKSTKLESFNIDKTCKNLEIKFLFCLAKNHIFIENFSKS